MESQGYTSDKVSNVSTSFTRSKSVHESPVELFIQDEHNKKWVNEGSHNNFDYQPKISIHRLFFLDIMMCNTCKTYVIDRKCWQYWWTKWTIVELKLGLQTLNVLLLFSSFDPTVNNICARYEPNFTNSFQLHMYDYIIRFMHIKRSIMIIWVQFQRMTTPLSIINI